MDPVEKKENYTLRSATAIMLFLIGYAHFFISTDYGYGYSQEFGDFIEVLVGFGRFCIPIFFMISGYFLFSEDGHRENRLGKKVLHIVYLIILFKVTYLILVGASYLNGDVSSDYLINSFVLFEMDSTVHIWFLYALLLMYLFFWALHKYHIDFRKIYWIAWIPLIFTMIVGNILPLFVSPEESINLRDNFSDKMYPFLGYTFFVFGYYLHQNKDRFDKLLSDRILWMFIIVGTALAIVECRYNMQRPLYFGTLLQIIGIFLITFRFANDQLRCRPLESIGRDLMPFFYVFMLVPVFICDTYLLGNISSFDFYILCPIVSVFAITLMAFVFFKALQFVMRRMDEKKKVSAS